MTTKRCQKCNGERLRLFASLNYKQCDQCGHKMPWRLDEGQRPLVGPSRRIK